MNLIERERSKNRSDNDRDFSSSAKQEKHNLIDRQPHVIASSVSLGEDILCGIHMRKINRRSSKPRASERSPCWRGSRVKALGEEKKNANAKREEEETEGEDEKEAKEEKVGEKVSEVWVASLAGNIYTVYDLAGASDRRGSDEGDARKNKEGKNEEEGHAKVKPSRFTGRWILRCNPWKDRGRERGRLRRYYYLSWRDRNWLPFNRCLSLLRQS